MSRRRHFNRFSHFRFPTTEYDVIRKAVGRTHRAPVSFANEEKRTYLQSELVSPNVEGDDGKPTFRRTTADLKEILGNAITARGRKSASRSSNESAAVRVVRSAAKELINDNPDEIYDLNREIELVTLEDVIAKFEEQSQPLGVREMFGFAIGDELPKGLCHAG